jgi:peptide/nickel transport system ATP-binding protein
MSRDALTLTLDDDAGRVAECYAHELSGGQQQRVCIAQAIVARPSLIIADEPTASLDGVAQRGVLDLFRRLRRECGTSLVFITHNPAILPGLVDRAIVFDRGRVVEDGLLRQVYRRPQKPETRRLIQAAQPAARPDRRPEPVEDGAAVLEARGVTKTYLRNSGLSFRPHRITAIENIDFDLKRQGSLALVGASGSGKSTLARCLAGLERPTRGSVVNRGSRRVQLVAQDAAGSLNPRFTASQAIAEPLAIAEWADAGARVREASRLMRATGLPEEAAGRRTSQFSGGQRQRLAVARAMAAKPEVVIWDESFSALDLPLQAEILELLETGRRELALSYIFIAHDLTLAARACDEIAVMAHGRIVERKPAAELLASPEHPCSRALVEAIPRIPADLEAIA